MNDTLKSSIDLFNQGKYYESHDLLESLWIQTSPDDKYRDLYQGIIQAAVSLHLFNEKRFVGSKKMLYKAESLLSKFKPESLSINIGALIIDLNKFHLSQGSSPVVISYR